MKTIKTIKYVCLLLAAALILPLAACGKDPKPPAPIVRVADSRTLTPQQYTVANIATTDALGRTVRAGDVENGKTVGVFYHVWNGYHNSGIYDITELLDNNPAALKNIFEDEAEYQALSPLGEFHYWGQPLYGYYCSDDPWVITRHIELLTMAGVDYLIYDLTNSVVYDAAINAIFKELEFFQEQGFDVPKVAFYTNSHSRVTLNRCYNTWYKDGKYSDLWYRIDGKPLIIGVSSELNEGERDLYFDFFTFKEAQWPFGLSLDLENGFPWMDWEYPQKNYNGTMSVSLAQHPGAKMSQGARSNKGRGFDYTTFRNVSANTASGSNYAGQWQTALTASGVDNVFITGFNEWIAIKYEEGSEVFFVDTYNQEYSRDIEMMKGGYADNYFLQTVDYVKQYKYTAAKHYLYNTNTIDIDDQTLAGWSGVTANFKDFEGDARARNFRNAARPGHAHASMLTDSSNRNDITDVSVTHDASNLYIKIVTAQDITAYNGTDLNWMNVFINTMKGNPSFANYDFVINRAPGQSGETSIEKSTGGYAFASAGSASYRVFGNVMIFSVPLSSLGLTQDNCHIQLKVSDNVTNYSDIEDYYVTGDSAPIGRLSYAYGH